MTYQPPSDNYPKNKSIHGPNPSCLGAKVHLYPEQVTSWAQGHHIDTNTAPHSHSHLFPSCGLLPLQVSEYVATPWAFHHVHPVSQTSLWKRYLFRLEIERWSPGKILLLLVMMDSFQCLCLWSWLTSLFYILQLTVTLLFSPFLHMTDMVLPVFPPSFRHSSPLYCPQTSFCLSLQTLSEHTLIPS